MTDAELQEEEREVLLSIYEGDENFKQINKNVFQYKYGENDNCKSFLLEIRWGEKYPSEKPEINMNTFYNNHIVKPLKEKVTDIVSSEAEQYLGMSMTYSLFEFVKEKFDELIQDQPEQAVIDANEIEKLTITQDVESTKKAPKKEQLTKAQKRRQWDRVDGKGEKPRGWDWVDIVKHLSQTGSKEDAAATS